jgi:hypothetical protein
MKKQIYHIITEVREEKSQLFSGVPAPQKNKSTKGVIAAFAAAVEEDRHQTVRGLASAHCQSKDTIRRILNKDLNLV